ncbi:PP2C family protein-serine/threonine phosphatase [Thalassovita taeanensis]|uniref:Serine phosphatase RsbU, regulator of sigma subunit n=1 Tax=Thalassovita taeanensis TaxID=657014 RepID=A0A1H9JKJ0_9RHOB|nr:SpoIIE family protein phosphatase [Thalassovita taeanensis]SEQ87511.1 Serine phosphatase RsbU, regulator of sigma subunit [Thalassovita taeanensis]
MAIRHVLIVDDSRLQRRILSASLVRWGYVVTEAESGEDALEKCAENPPDLVLSDWMMPGMDGLEFCQTFRQMPRESYGYFILLTSKSEKEAVAKGLDCGADDFLTKPVNGAELRARINAGERILQMERELTEKNKLIGTTLEQLQTLYDALDSDLIEAKKLQQSLIREQHRDFGAAQVSLLLRSSGHVGGDLVGFFPISATRIGLFAIDVSGHGISSALMTARLAGYLSSAAPDHNIALRIQEDGSYQALPPSDVVGRLNRIVLEEMETEHYFTLLLADVDLSTGRVVMVQAGHPHPVVQRADGSTFMAGVGGMPVGLFEAAQFDQSELTLEPGDRLVIQSDGVTECPDVCGEMLDDEGLMTILSDLKEIKGSAMLEALVWRLADHAGHEDFPDDISAILLEFRGPSEQAG